VTQTDTRQDDRLCMVLPTFALLLLAGVMADAIPAGNV
jgi:hypothetical protein